MENKEMYTKQEVVEMLKDMQRETSECVGFFVGQVSQLWVIKDLIEKRLNWHLSRLMQICRVPPRCALSCGSWQILQTATNAL